MIEKQSRTLVVHRTTRQTADIVSLSTSPLDAEHHGFDFTPGQVAILRTANHEASYFAIASAPEDATLDFLIKRGSPAANSLAVLHEGDRLELVEIVGAGFPLERLKMRDIVMIAMGTGIAPLRSVLRHALTCHEDFGKLIVLYGARTPFDFCYTDETESWREAGVELRQVVSRPENHDWSGATGYVQSLLDNILPELINPVALVCGSQEMIAHTRERLLEMGFAAEDILTNY